MNTYATTETVQQSRSRKHGGTFAQTGQGTRIGSYTGAGRIVIDPHDENTITRITEALRPLWVRGDVTFSRRHVAVLTLDALKDATDAR